MLHELALFELCYNRTYGFHLQSGKMSYFKISSNFDAARLGVCKNDHIPLKFAWCLGSNATKAQATLNPHLAALFFKRSGMKTS